MFMPSINNLVNTRLKSLCIIYLGDLFRGLMDAQWIFRGHHGSNARIEGGNIIKDCVNKLTNGKVICKC